MKDILTLKEKERLLHNRKQEIPHDISYQISLFNTEIAEYFKEVEKTLTSWGGQLTKFPTWEAYYTAYPDNRWTDQQKCEIWEKVRESVTDMTHILKNRIVPISLIKDIAEYKKRVYDAVDNYNAVLLQFFDKKEDVLGHTKAWFSQFER